MDVKVICQCQAKFQFEVQPVDGRMPASIQCPQCGADATDAANAVIAQKLAPATSAAPSVRVAAPKLGLSTAGHAPASAPTPAPSQPVGDPGILYCPRHQSEIAAAECFVCQKPICGKCMEQFGFLCSVFCKNQAEARHLNVPVYAGHVQLKRQKESSNLNLILRGAAAFLCVVSALYLWYLFGLSKPKTALKLETGRGTPFMSAVWLGEGRFFNVTPQKVTLLNASSGSEIWSVDLPANEIKGSKDRSDDWYFPFDPVVKVVEPDIWIGLPARVIRIDGKTGKQKQTIPLPRRVDEYQIGPAHFLAISRNPTNETKFLTRISLSNGQADTQSTFSDPGATRVVGITRNIPGLGNTSLSKFDLEDDDFSSTYYPKDPDFILAGPSVVHIRRDLIEARIAVQPGAKPKGKSILDNPNMRAGQSLEATEDFMNRNSTDVRIDESLYSVTLTRYFANGAEWKGQVAGRPYFFSEKTVDLLVAGNTLIAFNKNNQKLWEAKLTYSISPRYWESEIEGGPGLETGGRLLFFDQGVLTSFDLKTGKAEWRVNSVGISHLVPDNKGNVYVGSTTAGPERIKYSQQISLTDQVKPLLLKVELKTGKVLWQTPRVGSECIVSGDLLYTTDAQSSGLESMSAAMNGTDAPAPVHFRLHRLDPSNGKLKWEYHKTGVPLSLDAQGKRILLHSREEVRVLKFL